MGAPCAAVPSPGGRPAPSAWTPMSQAARSLAPIGLPRCGVSAKAGPAIQSAKMATALRIGVGHLAPAADRPTGDDIAMMIAEGRDGRLAIHDPARGNEFAAGRLDRALIVPGPALQDGGTAIPS